MPLYEVKCDICDKHQDIFLKLAEWNNLPECCGQVTHRVVVAPFVPQEFQPYRSMVNGKMITDRGEHRRHLKAAGVTEVGNESMEKKVDHFKIKKDKEALRQKIAERFN